MLDYINIGKIHYFHGCLQPLFYDDFCVSSQITILYILFSRHQEIKQTVMMMLNQVYIENLIRGNYQHFW